MARKLLTPAEIIARVPPFQSKNWERRKAIIAQRVHNHEITAGYAKVARLERLKQNREKKLLEQSQNL
jgi:hypothetical protein